MKKDIPTISVGMPVYNGEEYLESSINATLQQTYADFELIISDNASSDRTEEICRDFEATDQRVVYKRNSENIGAAGNYNQLFHMAQGEFFRWFNADDLCTPDLHERCLEGLKANPDAVMCYGKTDIIDGEGKLLSHYDDKLDLQHECVVDRYLHFFQVVGLTNAIYGLMRSSALKHTMLMGDSTYPAADTNLMAELALYGKFVELPETLFYRRMHEEASSWDRSNSTVQQTFWSGSNKKFKMPTFKKHIAYMKAVHRSPNGLKDKMQLQKFILKQMVWKRNTICREAFQAMI